MKRNFALALLFVLIGSVFNNKVVAQIQLGGDKLVTSMSIDRDGDEATVILKVTMDEHWHINAVVLPAGNFGYASSFDLTPSSKFKTVGNTIEPKPIEKYDEASGEDISFHEGTFVFKRKIKILTDEDFVISGYLDFQTCDESMCLPPFKQELKVRVVKMKADNEKFVEVNGDEAKDKDGVTYVLVNEEWYAVPKGNSTAFYKKYLTLQGNHEK